MLPATGHTSRTQVCHFHIKITSSKVQGYLVWCFLWAVQQLAQHRHTQQAANVFTRKQRSDSCLRDQMSVYELTLLPSPRSSFRPAGTFPSILPCLDLCSPVLSDVFVIVCMCAVFTCVFREPASHQPEVPRRQALARIWGPGVLTDCGEEGKLV